jgi:hypothetical protein
MNPLSIKCCYRFIWQWLPAVVLVIITASGGVAWAAFGENIEKPQPEFTRQGDDFIAKLIPRAKSTSVSIRFAVNGGKLLDVQGMDFEKAERPEVDIKNFKSALFVLSIGEIPPGGEVKVSLSSDFFISSTQFYVFNEKLPQPWMISEAENLKLPNRVQELVITVNDGGPFDSDGSVNGRITLIGGPRDSFWGYALGTLFIRFFGIFIVLSILMLGMILSGKVFQFLDRKKTTVEKAKAQRLPQEEKAGASEGKGEEISPEAAAAIAMALFLHFNPSAGPHVLDLFLSPLTSWTLHGRDQIMGERFLTFHRGKR